MEIVHLPLIAFTGQVRPDGRGLTGSALRAYAHGMHTGRPMRVVDLRRLLDCDPMTARSALQALESAGLAVRSRTIRPAAWTMVLPEIEAV